MHQSLDSRLVRKVMAQLLHRFMLFSSSLQMLFSLKEMRQRNHTYVIINQKTKPSIKRFYCYNIFPKLFALLFFGISATLKQFWTAVLHDYLRASAVTYEMSKGHAGLYQINRPAMVLQDPRLDPPRYLTPFIF